MIVAVDGPAGAGKSTVALDAAAVSYPEFEADLAALLRR
jgi:cytidylate kinase